MVKHNGLGRISIVGMAANEARDNAEEEKVSRVSAILRQSGLSREE